VQTAFVTAVAIDSRMVTAMKQGELFTEAPPLPQGLAYAAEFVTSAEEAGVLEAIRELPLREARYKGYTAKRRIASFGSQYDFESNERLPAPSMPGFLVPLREKAARWAGVSAARFAHALVSEYRPGTALGWHRDVPDFELIVGVSLAGSCRMRFRPYPPSKTGRPSSAVSRQSPVVAPFELELAPRSAYAIRDAARWGWQHSIPPTKSLRYSVTFRTLRERS
jgi:alkylated DNA repair dioxygenase AlkB